MCRGGRPQGSPLRCGHRRRHVWGRASIIFPDSPGNHAGGHRWGRTWKRPPIRDRRGVPCGCPSAWHRSPTGRSGRATGPARHPATTRGVRRRVPGRATARVAPTMRSPQATRLVPGVDHLPRFPRKSGRKTTGGRGPGNVRGPGTVGEPLVGAPRGRNVRRLGGRAAQPGRQGTRPRPVVCDAVCRRGRPQGSPLRCGRRRRRGWCRASITFPDSPGNQAGGHRWGRTWKRPRTGDRRGTPCGCPPGSQCSPAGWSGRATGPARHPATTRGVRRRVPGRATTRVAPTMRSPRATRLVPGVDHLPQFPKKLAGGH